ncbi:MAG: protein kinase domain-containing protein [Bacteroidales bacterium]
MTLAAGTRLGPYEIQATIGLGGMGEVYKSRDTRLGRTVAIKVLPAPSALDPARRARFEFEAKTIGGLNHPHICTLYDVGDQDGSMYLVMEYVPGETLGSRIRKGPLSLDQSLVIATEIADALAAAHRQGIVHRDLKPGNVMLTKSGVKLLDFGLAKLRPTGVESLAATSLKTCEPVTEQGTVFGTIPYMAPEQLEGREADARSDIFAFGAVLYEMVTGTAPFGGDSPAAVVAAILEHEPAALATFQPRTPPALDRLVQQCLSKSADDRPDTAHDVASELRWIRELGSGAVPVRTPTRGGRRLRLAALLAAACAIGLVAGALLTRLALAPVPPRGEVQRFLLDTTPADGVRGPHPFERPYGRNRPSRTAIALSPDGAWLVFAGTRGERQQLYRRRLSETAAVPLDGTDGGDSPFFSPDGVWIGFWARGSLWKMRLDSGAPIELCASAPIAGASWSSKGTIAFSHVGLGVSGTILAVPSAGGPPRVISTPDTGRGELSHILPQFLPDGQTLLFTVLRDRLDLKSASIAAVSLASGKRSPILTGAVDARYLPTGHLIYLRLGRLEAVPFEAATLAVTGDAVVLAHDVMQAVNSGSSELNTGASQVAVSETGTLVYLPGGVVPDWSADLVWVSRRGAILEALATPLGPYSAPRLSPDGRKVLYVRSGYNGASLWFYDLSRQTSTMIPAGDPTMLCPLWSKDGRHAMFAARPGSAARLYLVPVDGSGPSVPVGGDVPPLDAEYPGTWAPDGETMVFTRGPALWLLRTGGTVATRTLLLSPPVARGGTAPATLAWPAISPDGRWLAYVSDESERREVYVVRFPDLGGRQQVSREGGRAPVWRRDGRELFYVTEGAVRRMMAVDMGPSVDSPVGVPRILFDIPDDLHTLTGWVPAYDVDMAGQRFLFVRRFTGSVPSPPSRMHVVLNWFDEVKARVPPRK